jgi:hypothetical protein
MMAKVTAVTAVSPDFLLIALPRFLYVEGY